MPKPSHHILICSSSRVVGPPNGACNKRGAVPLIPYIEEGLSERGIENSLVSNAGCLKMCDQGPVMVVYPEGWWFGKVDENAVDAILDGLAKGEPAKEYLISA